MPVVATLTAIALLRGDGGGPAPFFDPEMLRELLTEGLEGIADDELQRSLAIVDLFESALERYRIRVDKNVDAYVDKISDPETDAADLMEQLKPLDRERADILDSIIEYRQQLIHVLDETNWAYVFEQI